VDRNFSAKGMKIPFFGREIMLPSGHLTLATRTGASLLPSWCSYDDGTIDIVIGEPVTYTGGGSPAEKIGKACIERIEQCIMRHPEQWFAFDHLWPEEPYA
jgi:KDO2-lipid IV(A) lauroyltransferase